MTEVTEPPAPARRRRSDGERSRAAILHAAGQLATVEGIEGLSIARLAQEVGMSKSGLFAHFGSKEELQLATVEAARAVFTEHVLEPAEAAPPGMERLGALVERFLRHVEDGLYPGGCFFASVGSEISGRPGPVRDTVVAVIADFAGRLAEAVREAQAAGEIDPEEDAEQLAFELDAYLLLGNDQYVIAGDALPMRRARRAVERRLTACGPRP